MAALPVPAKAELLLESLPERLKPLRGALQQPIQWLPGSHGACDI